MKNNKKNTQGFTLIELLVVISIIAILSTLATTALNEARAAARYIKVLNDMKQIATAAEFDYYDYGDYAPPGTGPVNGGAAGTPPRFVPEYLASMPTPPCYRWQYTWIRNGNEAAVFLRKVSGGPMTTPKTYYCVNSDDDCKSWLSVPYGITEIDQFATKKIRCD